MKHVKEFRQDLERYKMDLLGEFKDKRKKNHSGKKKT